MNDKYEFDYPDKLIPNRVCVALSKFGLNEFYASFKYLKMMLLLIISRKDDSTKTIREALSIIAKCHNNTEKTIITAFGKIFDMLPENFFMACPLYGKIKMNYIHKIKYMVERVLVEIKKVSMNR